MPTAQASLLEDFRSVKPSIFISVPKKWMELQDAAVWEAASDDPEETAAHLRVITGTRLRVDPAHRDFGRPVTVRREVFQVPRRFRAARAALAREHDDLGRLAEGPRGQKQREQGQEGDEPGMVTTPHA